MRVRGKLMLLALVLCAGQATGECVIDMHEKGVGTYYVHGSVAGSQEEEFLVDTGSGHMVVRPDTMEALVLNGQASYVGQITGILADGTKRVVPIFHVTEVRIGACVFTGVEAAVLPGGTRSILGMAILKRGAPFSFSVSPPQLVLSMPPNGVALAGP